jgi:hypothetical protein
MHRPPARAKRTLLTVVLLLAGLGSLGAGEVRTRFHAYTERWAARPDRAAVLAATRCGGGGTEWFAAGAIRGDGSVVAAGSALGPVFDPPGVPVRVLGRDRPAPPAPAALAPKERWSWSHPQATGFVVIYGPDLRSVTAAVRLPWGAGGITSACCDAQGNIYLAGPAGEGLDALGTVEDLVPASDPALARGPATATWIARLTADASAVTWIRRIRCPAGAPQLRLSAQGHLRLAAGDIYELGTDGSRRGANIVQVEGRADKGGTRFAVNPIDGRVALGGDRQWPTGREPYRDPWLHIHRPDGKLDMQLYWWNGGYIGLDNVRLESDSAIRLLRWTDDGDLVFVGWSDGGNSVFNKQPFDVRTPAPNLGRLGMEGWGMGVLSQAWLVRLDSRTWQPVAGTNWLSYLGHTDKPNGIGIDSLGTAVDGSFLIAGGSAWGLIRTGNHLTPGSPPGGSYVAVLSKGLDSLRFSSCLPGIGRVQVVDSEAVAFASGTVAGRPMALVLSGATATAEAFGEEWSSPTTVGAAQGGFGGGALDGLLLLLDLGPGGSDAPLSAVRPVRVLPAKAAATGPGLPTGLDDMPAEPAAPTGRATGRPGEAEDEAWLKK